MESHSSSGILKLNGAENWSVWRFQTEVILRGRGLLELTQGKEVIPEDEDKKRAWLKNDAKAQELIVTRMETGPITHLLTCTSATDMWTKLKSVYDKESAVSVHLLQQRFFTCEYKDDSMSTFLSRLEGVRDKLKQAGEEISDKMTITKILMTLPEPYKHFRSAWESVAVDDQKIEVLTSRLLMEEERLNNLDDGVVALAGVNTAISKKCFTCGKEGHIARFCFRNKRKPEKTCYHCKKKGHVAAQCYALKSKNGKEKKHEETEMNAFMSSTTDEIDPDVWYMDTGASEHMCGNKLLFESLREKETNSRVKVGDGSLLNIKGVGTVAVFAWNGKKYIKSVLSNVLYVPELKFNLFSAGYVMDKGFYLTINNEQCSFTDERGEIRAIAKRLNKLYRMSFSLDNNASSRENKMESAGEFDLSLCNLSKKVEKFSEWHNKLCHQNFDHIKRYLKQNQIIFEDDSADYICEMCLSGKQHRIAFPSSSTRASEVLELVHVDVCGPMEQLSVGGSKYFLLLKDDYSGFRTVYFLQHKSEVKCRIENYVNKAERETNRKFKILRSDNGSEFINKELNTFLDSKGIRHQKSVVYTPQQNGRAERDIRTLVEAARSALGDMHKKLWAEAINTVVYVLNRTSYNQCGVIPYEAYHNKRLNNHKFQVFGSRVSAHVPEAKRLKWDRKNKLGVFVGYGEEVKGLRVYFPETNRVEVVCDLVFFPPQRGSMVPSPSVETMEINKNSDEIRDSVNGDSTEDEFSEENVEEKLPTEVVPIPERIESESRTFLRPRNELKVPKRFHDHHLSFIATEEDTPKSYREAISCEFSEKWKVAMDNELEVLKENNTWTEVRKPIGKNIIDSKWVYKLKYDNDGIPSDFKARLVARGFQQDENFEAYDIYAPVAKLCTFRIMLAVANKLKLPVYHMDVRSAFLYGDICEEVYMKLPDGVECKENTVCKLNKSIYGLKKSPKYWNLKFDEVITKRGFARSNNDFCLYTKCNFESQTFLILFVDDILLFGSNKDQICDLKSYLGKVFCMKDLGLVTNYLGITVNQDLNNGITELSQKNFLKVVLKRFNMFDSKPKSTPMEHKYQYVKPVVNDPNYENKCRQMLGCIMYAVQGTRPDLCYCSNYLSRYQNCASESLYQAIKRLLRYVKNTIDVKLLFKSNNESDMLCGYVDSDWASDINDRKSTSGFVFKLFNCTVAWSSRKQSTVSLSSTEAECIALSSAVVEVVWLLKILVEDLKQNNVNPVKINIDNQAAINISNSPENNKRVKHVDIKFNYIKQIIDEGKISLVYIRSEDQLADMFTKSLGNEKFCKFREILCMS